MSRCLSHFLIVMLLLPVVLPITQGTARTSRFTLASAFTGRGATFGILVLGSAVNEAKVFDRDFILLRPDLHVVGAEGTFRRIRRRSSGIPAGKAETGQELLKLAAGEGGMYVIEALSRRRGPCAGPEAWESGTARSAIGTEAMP